MAKLKPSWMKTDLPKETKIKLWRVMIGCPTYDAWDKAIARNAEQFDKEEYKWLPRSRPTYKALQDEIREMPLEELISLPADLQVWIQSLRPELQIMSADEFLARHGDKIDPLMREVIGLTKPFCQLFLPSCKSLPILTTGETVLIFEILATGEFQQYEADRSERLERIKTLAKGLPNPLAKTEGGEIFEIK